MTTFSTSVTGETITNRLTDGIYAMDINAFADQISGFEEVVYLSRSDWNGTFPETYGGFGIKSGTDPEKAMKNDFYTLETNEDTSDIVFGDTESDLTFNDMKGASFDDDGWDELIAKIPVSEILDFMANAFHNIQAIPSIGFNGYAADDGPGGSDSHTLGEGAYRGQPYEDAEEYTGYGTRVTPSFLFAAVRICARADGFAQARFFVQDGSRALRKCIQRTKVHKKVRFPC